MERGLIPVGVLFRLKIAQAPAGLGQRGVGLVLLHSLAGFIRAANHADIVFLSHFVKEILVSTFSSHRFKSLTFRQNWTLQYHTKL